MCSRPGYLWLARLCVHRELLGVQAWRCARVPYPLVSPLLASTSMNAVPGLSIIEYRRASHGGAQIMVFKLIRVRKGPWNYAYTAGTHMKAGPLCPKWWGRGHLRNGGLIDFLFFGCQINILMRHCWKRLGRSDTP